MGPKSHTLLLYPPGKPEPAYSYDGFSSVNSHCSSGT
ncbi:hypothetical protein AVEN_224289-1, partial [Araneus ventricosus]